jgi:hypothetical protein
MKAHFKFFDKNNNFIDIITVNLFDNPGVKAWAYAVMLNNKERNIGFKFPFGTYSDPEKKQLLYTDIKQNVASLAEIGLVFNKTIPESSELIDQLTLNLLHRFFTECCLTIWNDQYTDIELQTRANSLLQKLNTDIHDLEDLCPNGHKEQWSQNLLEIWILNSSQEIGYDIKPFRKYHSTDHADVILDTYILGKTLIESFLTQDNPNHWDTSGHVRTNGGCCFMLSDTRSQIYKSLEFNNWLKQHGVSHDRVYADFPLGNFETGHKEKLKNWFDTFQIGCKCQVEIEL